MYNGEYTQVEYELCASLWYKKDKLLKDYSELKKLF